MNKKILIGSIIAVTVLFGVSFTSVVGYRSGASDLKASPLFNIRSSRAIDEENQGLVCEYVGKGEENRLSILKRDIENILIQKFINTILKNDDGLNNKKALLIDNLRKDKSININEYARATELIHLIEKDGLSKSLIYSVLNNEYLNEKPATLFCPSANKRIICWFIQFLLAFLITLYRILKDGFSTVHTCS